MRDDGIHQANRRPNLTSAMWGDCVVEGRGGGQQRTMVMVMIWYSDRSSGLDCGQWCFHETALLTAAAVFVGLLAEAAGSDGDYVPLQRLQLLGFVVDAVASWYFELLKAADGTGKDDVACSRLKALASRDCS